MSSIPPKSSTVAPSTPRGLEFVEDEIRDSFPTSYAQQEIRFRQDQIDRHNAWVERNAPPPMGDGEKRHFLRLLVISSALYHEERSSTTLTKKIASLVQAKQLEDPSLPRFNVDPDSPRLSAPLIRQMFNDVDYIMTNYKGGQSLASKALESLQLWRIDTQVKENETN